MYEFNKGGGGVVLPAESLLLLRLFQRIAFLPNLTMSCKIIALLLTLHQKGVDLTLYSFLKLYFVMVSCSIVLFLFFCPSVQ